MGVKAYGDFIVRHISTMGALSNPPEILATQVSTGNGNAMDAIASFSF